MNRFLRFGILSTLAGIFFCAFLGGCAAPVSTERIAMLSLPYNEFDQSYGSGFRLLYDRGEYLKAAVLIEDYLKAHRELTAGQQKFLHLHAAQMFALGSESTRAVQHLDLALSHEKTRELGPNWNDMLAATRAFLMHDREALIAAKERLAAAKSPQRVDNLLENFGSSYADVLLWHRLCSNVAVPKDASNAHREAAEKLANAFGFPITEVETNPPTGCIWVELRSFAPNPVPGYVIIHSGDGTLITASSSRWLEDAVERFIKSSRQRNGHHEARFGLATSFDVPR